MDINSYKDRKYKILPYNADWLKMFEMYSAKISEIFSDVEGLKIEHIGSTSINRMSGKDCIDVLVSVNDLTQVENRIEEMEKAGFLYAGQFLMEGSRLFRVMKDSSLLANIHFFISGHPHAEQMIKFRDYLRENPEEAENYSKLKEELFTKYPDDYSLYRKYKDEYVNSLNKRIIK